MFGFVGRGFEGEGMRSIPQVWSVMPWMDPCSAGHTVAKLY